MTPDAALMRDTERRRLRSLVDADMAAAGPLHADDYQLITPNGCALSKQDYLGGIAAGRLRYRVFEPVSQIAVWGSGPDCSAAVHRAGQHFGGRRAGRPDVLAHRLL